MAVFNPTVAPEEAPNYLGWSKAIEQPRPNQANELLYKGLGEAADQGINAINTGVKANIDDQIHTSVDDVRSQYTQNLLDAKDSLIKNDGDPSQQIVPPNVKTLPSTVGALQNARDNGKISETYYYQRLDTLAKDFRARYPGYREYIDQKISETTGVNPANAMVKSLIGDVDAAVTANKAQKDKIENLFNESAFVKMPNAAALRQAYHSGTISGDTVYKNFNMFQSNEHMYEVKKLQREDAAGDEKYMADQFKKDWDAKLPQKSSDFFNNFSTVMGADPDSVNTPAKVMDLISDVSQGKKHITDEQAQQLELIVQNGKTQFMASAYKDASALDKNGNSFTKINGPEYTKKSIEDNAIMYDRVGDALHNHDWGLAFTAMNANKAIASDTGNLMLHSSVGGFLSKLTAVNQLGGPQFSKDLLDKGIGDGQLGLWKTWLQENQFDTILQTDLRTKGYPKTISDSMDEATGKGAKPPLLRKIVDFPEQVITSKTASMEAKRNVAAATFSTANDPMLGKIAVDRTDDKGRAIPGRYQAYLTYGSPEMAQSMAELGKRDPKSFQNYQNWMENSFSTHLFRQEIQNMKDMKMPPGMEIGWNDERNRFVVRDPKTGEDLLTKRTTNAAPDPFIRNSLNRINMGLGGLENVAKYSGLQISPYLLKTMINAGYEPTGIAGQLQKAIAASAQPNFKQRFQP